MTTDQAITDDDHGHGHGVEAFDDAVDEAVSHALEEGTCGGCMVDVLLGAAAALIAMEFRDDRAELERQLRLCGAELSSSARAMVSELASPLH